MRNSISALTAFGLALAAGSTAASAQTVITRQISGQPVETVITQQPVQTVQTTETVRTIRPGARPIVRRRTVTTRQTVVSQQNVLPAPAPVQPLYDVVGPAPVPVAPADPYARPLYDTVAPAPTVDETMIDATAPVAPVAPVVGATAVPAYRYVYESDRILVIDPVTNIAVQSIPR